MLAPMKSLAMRLYRSTPAGFRRALTRVLPVDSLRRRYFETDSSMHDEFYTEEYYDADLVGWAEAAAPVVGGAMMREFRPGSVVDVGCGTGEFLAYFRDAGVPGHGAELAAAALKRCHEKGLDVQRIDLTAVDRLPWEADLVYCFEVAEHIPPEAASRFVKAITGAARRHVAITAARPGQHGLCHVNCQPKSYWVELFGREGFTHDAALTGDWERDFREADMPHWFCENLMVFHAPGAGQGADPASGTAP